MTFANKNDFISYRHHMFTKEHGKVVITEAGPRFEMQPYEVSFFYFYFFFKYIDHTLYLCKVFVFIVLLFNFFFYSRLFIFH
jgi:hypothetical protein